MIVPHIRHRSFWLITGPYILRRVQLHRIRGQKADFTSGTKASADHWPCLGWVQSHRLYITSEAVGDLCGPQKRGGTHVRSVVISQHTPPPVFIQSLGKGKQATRVDLRLRSWGWRWIGQREEEKEVEVEGTAESLKKNECSKTQHIAAFVIWRIIRVLLSLPNAPVLVRLDRELN